MMRCILTVASHRARTNPIPFTSPVLSPALLGTHILDYNRGLRIVLAGADLLCTRA